MCIGMFGTHKQYLDPHTRICMEDQPFFLVQQTLDWNWSAKATDIKYVESICGLGKEKSSKRAQGWLARAVNETYITNNTYSIQLVPQKLATVPVPDPETGKEYLKRMSFLTLGGWDEKDYTGNITWFETIGDSWNQTLTKFMFNGETIIDERMSVMFETGYPYIGLSNDTYDKVAEILRTDIPGMNCTKGMHWGLCRVKGKQCDQLDLNMEIVVTMNEVEFKIPLRNIAVYVNHTE